MKGENAIDEFASYFNQETTPRILMTTNRRPKGKIFDFMKEVKAVFPNTEYYERKNFLIKKVIEWAKKTKNISLIKDLHLENNVTYYSSVKNYDDLIVPYVIKYGRNNDFIWNVSSDDYLFL